MKYSGNLNKDRLAVPPFEDASALNLEHGSMLACSCVESV